MVDDIFKLKPSKKWGFRLNIPGNNLKPKRKTISKSLRNQVWLLYMGNKMQGKCYCCKIRTIHLTDFHVGHNKAVVRGGKNHISNLRPICAICNRGMKTKSIEKYRKKYFAKPKKKIIKKKIKRKKRKITSAPWPW